jgi:hypothetical protein
MVIGRIASPLFPDPNWGEFIRPGRSPGERSRATLVVQPNGVKLMGTAVAVIHPVRMRRGDRRVIVAPRWGFLVCGARPPTQGFARGLMNLAPSVLPERRGD